MPVLSHPLANLWRLSGNARRRLFGRPPHFVRIEVAGDLPEFGTPMGLLRRRLARGPAPLTLQGLRERLARISADGRVRGVVLRVGDLGAGWAAIEEARAEIGGFQGRVVAFLDAPVDTRSYYLACAADEILAAPLATIGVTGVRTRVTFLKDALDRLGVGAEVVAVSPYKSAGEPFTRNDFSPESREQARRLLDGRHREVVRAIAGARGLDEGEVARRIDGAPYGARQAVEAGLIDGVCYEDGLPERLAAGGERVRVAGWEAARRSLAVPYRRSRRRVGLVEISGSIARGRSRRMPLPLPLLGRDRSGSESVVAAIRGAERNRRISAVLLHVDSPGGDALASDLIWREVERVNRKKPVVVLMGNVAASGGYYVSAPASHIVARRSTVTGSIGVIALRPVAEDLLGRLGVSLVGLERGRRAGLADPSRRPTQDELEVLEGQMGHIYDAFRDTVTRGRGLSDLGGIAGGRVWSGAEARERGLVDGLGGFREAFGKACELGAIREGDPSEVLTRVSAPRSGRPAPGEPAGAVAEMIDGVGREVAGLFGASLVLMPYEFTDGW